MVTDWSGRSLKFIRQVTRQPPKYASATEAMEDSNVHQIELANIPGLFLWYTNPSHPYGNVALYLGDGLVLTVGMGGYPVIMQMHETWLGEYVGWSQNIGPDHAEQ